MEYIAIHHTSVSREKGNQLRAVNNYHRDKWYMQSSLGYFVGYSYFIDSNGVTTQCRAEEEEAVAVVGHNFDTIHICLALNGDVEMPSKAQIQSLKNLIHDIKTRHPGIKLSLHRLLQAGRVCPGKMVTESWIESIVADEIIPLPDRNKQRQIEAEITLLNKLIGLLRSLLNLI